MSINDHGPRETTRQESPIGVEEQTALLNILKSAINLLPKTKSAIKQKA